MNPFERIQTSHGQQTVVMACTIPDRLAMVKTMGADQLRAVMSDHDNQLTVRLAAERRLRSIYLKARQ